MGLDFRSGLWRAVLWLPFHGCRDCGCLFVETVHSPESCLLHWTTPAVCIWSIPCSWTITSVGNDTGKLIFRLIQGINIKTVGWTQIISEISSVSKNNIIEKPHREPRLCFQNWKSTNRGMKKEMGVIPLISAFPWPEISIIQTTS